MSTRHRKKSQMGREHILNGNKHTVHSPWTKARPFFGGGREGRGVAAAISANKARYCECSKHGGTHPINVEDTKIHADETTHHTSAVLAVKKGCGGTYPISHDVAEKG